MNNVKVKALLLTVLVASSPLSAGRFADWTQLAKNGFGSGYGSVRNGLGVACANIAEVRKPFQWALSKSGELFGSSLLSRAYSVIASHPKIALASLAAAALGGASFKGVQYLRKNGIPYLPRLSKKASGEAAGTKKQEQPAEKKRLANGCDPDRPCLNAAQTYNCKYHQGSPIPKRPSQTQTKPGCSGGGCRR